jgi:ribose 5-phosphate isomerase B
MIGIGSDHNGFELKQRIAAHLAGCGHEVEDFGSFTDQPVDYPDVAVAVARAVQAGSIEQGILVCGTGLGMAIAANKVPGIFAAPVADTYTARLARESNDAQIITLGANVIGPGLACEIVETWLTARFRGGESARKVSKIRALEQRNLEKLAPALLAGGHRW